MQYFLLTEAGETGQVREITCVDAKQHKERVSPDICHQRTVGEAYRSVKSEAFNSKGTPV